MSEKGRTRKDLYGEYGKEGPLFLLNGHHCLEVRSCFAYDSGYPSFAAREMCDYDILFDSKRAIDVKSIMESLGFQVKAFGEFKEDVYHKPPVSNIEMHRMLFGEKHDTKLPSLQSTEDQPEENKSRSQRTKKSREGQRTEIGFVRA